MAYFNHAYHKCFVATGVQAGTGTPGDPDGAATAAAGLVTTTGMHVSNLKSTAASEGWQLGPGFVGIFDAKTNLSIDTGILNGTPAPFYLAAASLKINDKQGPFHGGYQESNKSKVINPKYIRKTYKVESNAAGAAYVEVGGVSSGAALTFNTLVGGTGYTGAAGVATTGGSGTGLVVTTTDNAGAVDSVVITTPGVGYEVGDVITISGGGADATFTLVTVGAACDSTFLCGETYYLRVEAKGHDALRFANHNLYRTLDASGGCCADPSNPVAVDDSIIYLEWATQIAEDPYLKDFINPLLVVDGQAYAYDAARATAAGLDPATELFADAPTTTTHGAGISLLGAYVETSFGDCTFQPTDYYSVEPIQIFASEVDLNGDPCTFSGVCVTTICAGVQANGTGEKKVRDVITSESYLQNFMSSDLRIREITQGTSVYDILDRTAAYGSFYILHSVPRFNNPSGVFDNDQYLLEIIGSTATLTAFEDIFNGQDGLAAAGFDVVETEDNSQASACTYTIPNP